MLLPPFANFAFTLKMLLSLYVNVTVFISKCHCELMLLSMRKCCFLCVNVADTRYVNLAVTVTVNVTVTIRKYCCHCVNAAAFTCKYCSHCMQMLLLLFVNIAVIVCKCRYWMLLCINVAAATYV